MHHKNIQTLATKMLKVKHGLCPEITGKIQKGTYCRYNLRYMKDFRTPLVERVYRGRESIAYIGPKIGDIVPDETKKKTSLKRFGESIRKWAPTKCPGRLCKVYVGGVGFIEIHELQ